MHSSTYERIYISQCGTEKQEMNIINENTVINDVRRTAQLIERFCLNNHSGLERTAVKASGKVGKYIEGSPVRVCLDCKRLLLHSASRRVLCPHDPKPECKHCKTPCHKGVYRDRIRQVMRFSRNGLQSPDRAL